MSNRKSAKRRMYPPKAARRWVREDEVSIDNLCEPPIWIVERRDANGIRFDQCNGVVWYWNSEQDAQKSVEQMSVASQNKRTIRRLWESELAKLGNKNLQLVVTKQDKESEMSKKITSVGCLVDIYEDYETRKFAIATKASTEDEFLVEVAQALAASGSSAWDVRLREMLPLIVDMCCKYRGYKAERVFERRELVAGDLEMPMQAR